MKRVKLLLAALLAVSFAAAPASAKWWIFGQSADEVAINHLYLNGVSFDEGGPSTTLLADQLPNGLITVKGKASAGKAKIGAVQVSVDNKAKWDKAKLSSDGAFEYSFKPEAGKTYDVYVKVLDTRGKTNDVDRAYKKVVVSNENLRDTAMTTLDDMMNTYRDRNLQGFMTHVSEDFTADRMVLQTAVQRDFSTFSTIRIWYTVNNITRDSKGYVSVSITFNRQLTSSRTGQTTTDNGVTEFTFRFEDTGFKLYAMKMPLIFGLSDAANVATGVINTPQNNNVIFIDPTGKVSTGAVGSAPAGTGAGTGTGSGTASAGSPAVLTYNNTALPWSFQSFALDDGTVSSEVWGNTAITGDFALYGDNHHMLTRLGVTVIDLGVTTLSQVTGAPASGYAAANGSNFHATAGHVYIFKLPGNAYGAVQIVSTSIPLTMFRYKYSASATFQ